MSAQRFLIAAAIVALLSMATALGATAFLVLDRTAEIIAEVREPADDTERFLLFRRVERIEQLVVNVCASIEGCDPPD